MAENLIKAHKRHLASDRRPPHAACCVGWPHLLHQATANQLHLLVHTAAYWLLRTLKGLAPKTSFWRDAQLDTRRLAFIKIAARVAELVTRIKVSLPSSYADKQGLARLPAVPRRRHPEQPGSVPAIEPAQPNANTLVEVRKCAPSATLTTPDPGHQIGLMNQAGRPLG
jgi:hypothetical protein